MSEQCERGGKEGGGAPGGRDACAFACVLAGWGAKAGSGGEGDEGAGNVCVCVPAASAEAGVRLGPSSPPARKTPH